MSSEVFLQEKKGRDAEVYKRVRLLCIVLCICWIPVALFFLYKPPFLSGEGIVFDGATVGVGETVSGEENISSGFVRLDTELP